MSILINKDKLLRGIVMIRCDLCKNSFWCDAYCSGNRYNPSVFKVAKYQIKNWMLKKLGFYE